jgi:hypothetical protein
MLRHQYESRYVVERTVGMDYLLRQRDIDAFRSIVTPPLELVQITTGIVCLGTAAAQCQNNKQRIKENMCCFFHGIRFVSE